MPREEYVTTAAEAYALGLNYLEKNHAKLLERGATRVAMEKEAQEAEEAEEAAQRAQEAAERGEGQSLQSPIRLPF